MLVEKLITERDIYDLSRNPEFTDFSFVGYRETALSIDLVALVEGDGLTERDIVNRRDHFFETTCTLPRDFCLKPRGRNPNGLLGFVFTQAVAEPLIQFIRKQTKIAHSGNGGLIVSWSITLKNRQIHTHRNPVSLLPPVFSPPRLIYPGLSYLQDQVGSYQLLTEKPDEIIAQSVSPHKSDRNKGNHFEGAADVGGDVISADEIHKHYYYGMSGTMPPENSEFGNESEKKRDLQSLLRSYQRNHRRL